MAEPAVGPSPAAPAAPAVPRQRASAVQVERARRQSVKHDDPATSQATAQEPEAEAHGKLLKWGKLWRENNSLRQLPHHTHEMSAATSSSYAWRFIQVCEPTLMAS